MNRSIGMVIVMIEYRKMDAMVLPLPVLKTATVKLAKLTPRIDTE